MRFRSNKQLGGLQAKRKGDLFERMLEINCRLSGFNLVKIYMGCEQFKRGLQKRKNPFDYIIQKRNDVPVFIDAKTRATDSITYSEFWSSKSTKHQVETMIVMSEFGAKSGFVVWFRASDRISFIPIQKVESMKARTSFGPDDGIELGTIDEMKLERIWD